MKTSLNFLFQNHPVKLSNSVSAVFNYSFQISHHIYATIILFQSPDMVNDIHESCPKGLVNELTEKLKESITSLTQPTKQVEEAIHKASNCRSIMCEITTNINVLKFVVVLAHAAGISAIDILKKFFHCSYAEFMRFRRRIFS